MAKHLETGKIGEDIACKFLKRKGYKIIDRNYRKKFGELDIVAEKRGIIIFVEVKTITARLNKEGEAKDEVFRPEEKVDDRKMQRIGRAIRTYLQEKSVESDWKFEVLAVIFDPENKLAKVKVIEDVVPE